MLERVFTFGRLYTLERVDVLGLVYVLERVFAFGRSYVLERDVAFGRLYVFLELLVTPGRVYVLAPDLVDISALLPDGEIPFVFAYDLTPLSTGLLNSLELPTAERPCCL